MSDEGFPEDDSTDDSDDDAREGDALGDGAEADSSNDGADAAAGEHLHQQFQFQPISARVPERVARGVFSTGAIVLQGPDEFVIDFILKLANPHQIVARVVLPMTVVPRFIMALQENLRGYEHNFGGLPAMPVPRVPMPGDTPPDSIEDLYDHLKLSDDMLGGTYANAVMIGHAGAEFCFDFIANLYPKSVVTARVFMSSPQVPGLLDVLMRTWKKFEESQGRPPENEDEDDEDEVDEDDIDGDDEE